MGEFRGTGEVLIKDQDRELRIVFALTGIILRESPHRRALLKREDFLTEKLAVVVAVYAVEARQDSRMWEKKILFHLVTG